MNDAIELSSWIEAVPDRIELPCSICGGKVTFGYLVDDEVWDKVCPDQHRKSVLCLSCFDFLATIKGIDISQSIISLYFLGNGKSIRFNPIFSFLW